MLAIATFTIVTSSWTIPYPRLMAASVSYFDSVAFLFETGACI
jgi:hypothetical protein